MSMGPPPPPPLRVLCLSQGALDALCALGLQDCLVGRPHDCTGPPSVLDLPCFSPCRNPSSRKPGLSLDWELLKGLKPDVIFTQNQLNSDDADLCLQLHSNDITNCRIVELQSNTVEDVFRNLETIANYCGVGKEGAKLVCGLRLKWKMITQKTPQWADGMPRVNVVCIACANPLTSSGYWIPEIISSAGGFSLCSKAGYPNQSITVKDLARSDPDVILYLSQGLHFGIIARELSRLVTLNEWRKIKAIKANRFFVIDAKKFFIDSAPSIVLSTEIMAEILHGFEYGHAGKGFLRWTDPSVTKQLHAHGKQFQESIIQCRSTLQAHSESVIKTPASAKGNDQGVDDSNAEIDVRQKDEVIGITNKGVLIDSAVLTGMDSTSRLYDMNSLASSSPQDKWPNPVVEIRSYNPSMTRKAVSSLSAICEYEQEEGKEQIKNVEKNYEKPTFRDNRSIVNRTKKQSERYLYEQEIISKVWAITQSAAKNRHMVSTTPNSEGMILMKCLEVSSRAKKGRPKVSSAHVRLEGCKNEVNKSTKISHSTPLNPVLQGIPKQMKILRDSLLKSLDDLQYLDCLLLSGGLGSSTLSGIASLVDSRGFKIGFTILAGPEAMDSGYAEVMAKYKTMNHVIIGDKSKESVILLLAKELPFIVETLKTFDPFQIRGAVPITVALREAKSRGFKCVVTGDGLDELLLRDGLTLTEQQVFQLGISKILSKCTVLLGEALGIKVFQPFLQPKFVDQCKALSAFGAQTLEGARSIWKKAFPEVSHGCESKNSIEFGSGMHYVTEYFSSAISPSILAKQAKLIHLKERIHIHSAEQLVYYRAFKRVFKAKIPKGLVRWQKEPCSQCGYQLSSDMNWYCLVCGYCKAQQAKMLQPKEGLKLALPNETDNGSRQNRTVCLHEESGAKKDNVRGGDVMTNEQRKIASLHRREVEASSVKDSDGEAKKKVNTTRNSNLLKKDNPCGSRGSTKSVSKPTNLKSLPESCRTSADKPKSPGYLSFLVASAGFLLLLQLSKG